MPIVVLAFFILFANWGVSLAHGQEEHNQEGQNSETTQQVQITVFTEMDNKLIFDVDVSGRPGMYLATNAENQLAWQYVGPADTDEVGACNDGPNGWVAIASSAKTAILPYEDTGDPSLRPTKASLTINLREDANNQTWYCFRVPTVAAGAESALYVAHVLRDAPPPEVSGFTFKSSLPLANSEVPASINVVAPATVSVDAGSWEYTQVESDVDCHAGNTELQFSDKLANNILNLKAEDAGSVFCFRVMLADEETEEDTYLYDAYLIPGATSATAEDSSGSTTINWVVIILLFVSVGAIIFVVARRPAKS